MKSLSPCIAAFALASLAACSSAADGGASSPATPEVPEALAVPPGHAVFLDAPATGVQIYACQSTTAKPDVYAWTFKAPEAVLVDAKGAKVATHYAGPTWESIDASKVVGEVSQKADAPNAGAIPWLLLKKKSAEGDGTLAKVTYVQRLDTVGGVAPTTACDASHKDEEARVAYTATYFFYAAK